MFTKMILLAATVFFGNFAKAGPAQDHIQQIYDGYKALPPAAPADLIAGVRTGYCYKVNPTTVTNDDHQARTGFAVRPAHLVISHANCARFRAEKQAAYNDAVAADRLYPQDNGYFVNTVFDTTWGKRECTDGEVRAHVEFFLPAGPYVKAFVDSQNRDQVFFEFTKEEMSLTALMNLETTAAIRESRLPERPNLNDIEDQLTTTESGDPLLEKIDKAFIQKQKYYNALAYNYLLRGFHAIKGIQKPFTVGQPHRDWMYYSQQISGDTAEYFSTGQLYRSCNGHRPRTRNCQKPWTKFYTLARTRIKEDSKGNYQANIVSRRLTDLGGLQEATPYEMTRNLHALPEDKKQWYCSFPK